MASPFPGMDPYLEHLAFWSDFHSTFINYWREAIADQLPDRYAAEIGKRVTLVEPDESEQRIGPDVVVSNGENRLSSRRSPAPAGVHTVEPVTLRLIALDPVTEHFIRILHRPDRSLVAVLEVLSPANKEEPGFSIYQDKREAILRQLVHLIELDLLQRGHRSPLQVPLPPGDYFAFIARAEERWKCQVYPWSLRQPLPALPIPLRAPDPDIWVDMQAVFNMAFERGRFAKSLPYDRPPPIPLGPQDQAWVRERLQNRPS